MPTYEYVCGKCEKTFDVFQSMNDPRLETCPDESCGGVVKRKIGTGAGFIFKGAGFYATDYRSSSYKEGAKKEKSAASPSKESKSKGSESSKSKSCCGGACSH